MKKIAKGILSGMLAAVMVFTTVANTTFVFAVEESSADYEMTKSDTTYSENPEKSVAGGDYSGDTILVKAVAPAAVVQDGHNVVDKDSNNTFNVNIDLSQVENFAAINDGFGICSYTFFVNYNPKVVKMTGVVGVDEKDKDKYVHYETKDAFGNITKHLIYDPVSIAESIAYVPDSDNPDYADVMAKGEVNTLTCAELGKVKFANIIYTQNADKTIKTANNSGTLVTLTFEVVGVGDTEICVDAGSDIANGFQSNPTAKYMPVTAELPADIRVGEIGEATTETTTYPEDAILVQPVAPAAVAQDGHNVVDKDDNKTFDVNIDLSQVENFAKTNNGLGINSYTFYVNYNPNIVRMTGTVQVSTEEINKYVTYDTTDSSGNVTKNLFFDPTAISNNIKRVPGNDDIDYTDIIAGGSTNILTCAELGRVKFANCIRAYNEDKTLKTANNSGTLVTLKFEVVGAGDTEISVDVESEFVDGFQSNPTALKMPVTAVLAADIRVGDVKEETTTETTSVSTTETSSESTTEITSVSTTETTSVSTTETTSVSTTETTSVSTTETSSEVSTETSSEATTGTIELDVIADINMDGKVTADDAAFLLQRVLVLEFVLPCAEAYPDKYYYIADVNADGILTADDSAYILQKTLDFSFEFPVEQVIKGEKQYDYPVNQK